MIIGLLEGIEAHYVPVEFAVPPPPGRAPLNRGLLDVTAALEAFAALGGI